MLFRRVEVQGRVDGGGAGDEREFGQSAGRARQNDQSRTQYW